MLRLLSGSIGRDAEQAVEERRGRLVIPRAGSTIRSSDERVRKSSGDRARRRPEVVRGADGREVEDGVERHPEPRDRLGRPAGRVVSRASRAHFQPSGRVGVGLPDAPGVVEAEPGRAGRPRSAASVPTRGRSA